ncbi:interferon-induced protein 44-like isoform X2 [Brachyhypopomus gauderio]|uniref:interferon-induced protein 44-like isoform X2 n=1 Tax=Brachyhypopomus gauderio TaxID=698409 RepID=UPI004043459D
MCEPPPSLVRARRRTQTLKRARFIQGNSIFVVIETGTDHNRGGNPNNTEFDKPWRPVTWNDERNKDQMLDKLKKFQPGSADVSQLRILVNGPVGAGKSSFITSINNALQGYNTAAALASSLSDSSFTLKYKTHRFKKNLPGSFYPFVLNDIMGLEEGNSRGVHSEDIIGILQGHIKQGYTFNPVSPIAKDNKEYYNDNPSFNDKVHCLVSVLPANSISLMSEEVIKKLKTVREKARDLEIPQVIIMSMVDKTCPIVQEDLSKIYRSMKIKEKMQECSYRLGIPMNCIFPVQNYHEQITNNTNMDILLLMAITKIIDFANDYVEDQAYNQTFAH